jgi:hypothetical protein
MVKPKRTLIGVAVSQGCRIILLAIEPEPHQTEEILKLAVRQFYS